MVTCSPDTETPANKPKAKITKLRVCGKTSDMCSIVVADSNGVEILDYDGYVPEFFPGEHFGDYLELDIDVETGTILNWKKPSQKVLEKWVKDQKAKSR